MEPGSVFVASGKAKATKTTIGAAGVIIATGKAAGVVAAAFVSGVGIGLVIGLGLWWWNKKPKNKCN